MSDNYGRILDARCVTIDEINEVAAWCKSSVGIMYEGLNIESQSYIQVANGITYEGLSIEGQPYIQVANERAVVGDWIVTDGFNFMRQTDEEYKESFEAAKKNRKMYIEILEIVGDAISAAAPHVIHGVGVDRDIVAEQAALRIMQIL
jgi:hypothetical protein